VAGLDQLVQRLQDLGFSQYEARAYCALLQKSPAIPTSKIYETLERLYQKGAVLVQRSEPTLWAPVPHRDLVATLRAKLEATFSAVEQGLAQLGHEQDTKGTWSLSGRGHVVDSMRAVIDRAHERVAAAIPAAQLAELAKPLRAAAERGVAIDLVAGAGPDLELPDDERVRVRRLADGEPDRDRLGLVVGDGVETVLADLGRERPAGMWTHDPAVALLAAEHLRVLG
jgi:sugar-specific transcriptional regulator TrmB